MYKIICSLVLLLSTTLAFTQTKLIQHRSHSGSDETFQIAYQQNDLPNSNLGMAPRHYVLDAQMDSLIYIHDSLMIMVTSKCRYYEDDFNNSSSWKPGRDTLKYHPIFSKCHQLDKVKRTIKYDYNFSNQDKIIYIGYDNDTKPKTKPLPKTEPTKIPCNKIDKASIPATNNNSMYLALLLAFGSCAIATYKMV
jgi:hypothetical protein